MAVALYEPPAPPAPVASVQLVPVHVEPAIAEEPADVLVPTVMVVRATSGLDGAALDAAADMRSPSRRAHDSGKSGGRRPRRFGSR